MKKSIRKVLSLILALAMILTLAPLAVFAEDEPAPADPVVAEEPAEPVEEPVEEPLEDPGSVVAVVYGDAMEAALLAVEQDYNLLEDEWLGGLTWRGRTIPKLQNIKGDATPEATFVLEDADGNAVELVKDEAPKGSEYVEIIGEKPELLTAALDGIQANSFTVYRADGLAPGNYTLKLTYMVEPYGIRNAVALSQSVLVESGKTTIAGGDSIEVRGHVNVKEQVEDGTEQVRVIVGYEEVTHSLFGYTWTTQEPIYEYVEQTKYKTVTTPYEHTLNFKGYFLRKETMGFKFRTTDVVGEPVQGAEFVMVNRDELLGLLEPVVGVGRAVFTTAIQNLGNPEVFSFEELVQLHTNLLKQNEQGYIALDMESVYGIIQAYLGLLSGVGPEVLAQFVDYDEAGNFAGLKHPLPAVLSAKSDENGVVTFTESSNVTLTWLITIITDFGANILDSLAASNPLLQVLLPLVKGFQIINHIEDINFEEIGAAELIDLLNAIPDFGNETFSNIKNYILSAAEANSDNLDDIMDNALVRRGIEQLGGILVGAKGYILDFVYGQLQNFGIVGDKISKGNYLLFEYKTPDAVMDEEGNVVEDFSRSPLVYTVNIDWKEPDNIYASVTDLGLIGPYIAPQFYDFVRGTQYEGVVAKYFGKKAWDYDFLSKLMTGRIALAEKEKQQVEGAFTAFMAYSLYDALGLDLLFNTRTALMQGMNDYLVSQKDTATNLRNYVNTQAKKAKSVYAGTLTPLSAEVEADDLWTFYTLDASPTLTATKLIDKSTKDIAAAFPEGSERQKGILQNGGTVSSIVSRIGNSIEGVAKSIASRIQEAIGSVVENAIKSITDGVKNLFTSALGNLFGGNSNAAETPTDAGA